MPSAHIQELSWAGLAPRGSGGLEDDGRRTGEADQYGDETGREGGEESAHELSGGKKQQHGRRPARATGTIRGGRCDTPTGGSERRILRPRVSGRQPRGGSVDTKLGRASRASA